MRLYQIMLFVVVMLLFYACDTPSAYENFNAMPLQKNVYQHHDFQKDKKQLYTVSSCVQRGNFLEVFEIDNQADGHTKVFAFYEPLFSTTSDTALFKTTYLNYDLLGDSVVYLEKKEQALGTTKTFTIDGVAHTILRQPQCVFCKIDYNAFYFFHEKFGLLLKLTKYQKDKLITITDQPAETNMMRQLVRALEQDTSFLDLSILKKTYPIN